MDAKFARLFAGCHCVVIPDRDTAGESGARVTAACLAGVAASVKIATLPGELKESGGDDVRDVLAKSDGEALLRQAIDDAREWRPGDDDDASTNDSWPHIISLDEADLPSFPTHALPPVLSAWVEAESHATQTPAELSGLLALAVCSSCLARLVIVEPRPSWREPTNLFVAILLDPGNRKSAVFADAMQPLRELEAESIEAARPRVARDQSERRQAEIKLKKLEKARLKKTTSMPGMKRPIWLRNWPRNPNPFYRGSLLMTPPARSLA